jgi:predicted RNA-binding protein (TIGR00451 family)
MQKQLSKKEIIEINDKLKQLYNLDNYFDKKDKLLLVDNLIKKENKIIFFYNNQDIVPHLKTLLQNNFLPKIVIDMQAIKFIANGSDVMRPGIKEIDNFQKDAIIAIVDETHKKPLAIGKAMFSSEEMRVMDKGKVILNLHHVGDEFWNS